MKTFRQWFDNLSPVKQRYLRENCSWIDVDSKDRYNHPSKEKLDAKFNESVLEMVAQSSRDRYYSSNNALESAALAFFQLHKDLLNEDAYKAIIKAATNNGTDRDINQYVDAFELREIVKVKHEERLAYNKTHNEWDQKNALYSLSEKLLITEDFSAFDWTDTDVRDRYLDSKMMEILGHDEVIRRAKENPRAVDSFRNREKEIHNPVFDELFFCEDGWTKEQKQQVINSYGCGVHDVEDFIARIVAVDESYLRYIGTYFIRNCPALGMHLYKQKKSQEEIDALPLKHRQEDEYRYSKSYRKLFQIAACCARENVGKAMAGTIGDISGILKMYSYNFNQIFDCLYPQYAEAPEADPPETVAV